MDTIFVTGHKEHWQNIIKNHDIVSPTEYLLNERFMSGNYRVINLCKDYSYQSNGYYVSLLAQARGHKIIPSIMTIQDSKIAAMIDRLNEAISDEIQSCLRAIKTNEFSLSIYFGKAVASKYDRLANRLYSEFPHPMFRTVFKKRRYWFIDKIQVLSITDIIPSHYEFLGEAVKAYCERRHFRKLTSKKFHYDVGILYNPDEKNPPSNKKALQQFIKAGADIGLNVNLITKDDYKMITEYDGIFIRETTAVNHHTYRFARKAASENLFIVDDPQSILKCANKVYMAEYLEKHHIPAPKTTILSKSNYRQYLNTATFPCVLKLPDSAFSIGVKKIGCKDEFLVIANEFFNESDLLIVQEFMPSDYDWRIGIIENAVFFACRYFMAKDHWQIYNWDSSQEYSGEFETVAVEEVPANIKKVALKATKGIGSGLYGVDIKVIHGKPFVIEINDNPNIDAGIEDKVAGDLIYHTVMEYFLRNLNKMHGHA